MPPFSRLKIPSILFKEMIAHVRDELPNECCGLLAGRLEDSIAIAVERLTITNDLASPTRYLTNARDLFAAFRRLRDVGLELLAVYHSHPNSVPIPSRRDVEENTYGETVIHLIIGLSGTELVPRGWWLAEENYREAAFEVIEGGEPSAATFA
jgi:proteasome lid subunit RPN8/RPN11